jgi:16S rRNA (adenine1518-N6/adenine1519-N6)-dimethyltransferase
VERPTEKDTVLSRLRRAGLHPRKVLGQHFLHDPRILADIAEAAELGLGDAVLEVGTGPGTLTRVLAEKAGKVLTVEIDAEMLDFARAELQDRGNVQFLRADALDGKSGLGAEFRRELEALGPFKLVANLPYAVATPLLLALLESGLPLILGVVTIQKELATRLAAPSSTRDYGPATAIVSYWAHLRRVRTLPRGAFWPPPAVASEVVRLEPRPAPLGERSRYPSFRAWVHRLFTHRRKQLGGLLREALGEEEAGKALGVLALGPSARPEEIPPQGFVVLAERYPTIGFDKGSDII